MSDEHIIYVEWSDRHQKFVGVCSQGDFRSKPHELERKVLRAGKAHCEAKNNE